MAGTTDLVTMIGDKCIIVGFRGVMMDRKFAIFFLFVYHLDLVKLSFSFAMRGRMRPVISNCRLSCGDKNCTSC